MKRLKNLLSSSLIILILFSFAIATESVNAQQLNKEFDLIGGGGSSNRSEESESGNTMYIVGGVLLAGVLLYALLRDKKEPEKNDTTAVINSTDFLVNHLNSNQPIDVDQSKIPLNIFIGLQNDKAIKKEKRYYVGLSYNF